MGGKISSARSNRVTAQSTTHPEAPPQLGKLKTQDHVEMINQPLHQQLQTELEEDCKHKTSLTVARQCYTKPKSVDSRSKASLNSQEASSIVRAVSKLRELLAQLERQELPEREYMTSSLTYTVDILSAIAERSSPIDEIGTDLQHLVPHDEVRAWLASTFTSRDSTYSDSTRTKPSFKAVCDKFTIRKMTEAHHLTYSPGVAELFQQQLDGWNCDIFEVERLTSVHPLKFVAYEIFKRHGILSEFKIPSATLEIFLTRVEEGYQLHGNSYHNGTHAADVVQTVHSFIKLAKLEEWFTKLEILALLFSAVIHDVEHTGTSNNFHVQSHSELSLCYNDQSVLENYHLNRAYMILKEDEANIFRNLTSEQYTKVRVLAIEMVLATDMSKHFEQLKYMKRLLSSSDVLVQLEKHERSKLLSLFLHMADISHPGKAWNIHHQWTERIQEEFFRQGDREKAMNLPCSPLCDRTSIAISESQKGFIDFIVQPSFTVFGETVKIIFEKENLPPGNFRVWEHHIKDNYENWQDKCRHKDDKSTSEEKPELNGGPIEDTHQQDT